MKPVLAIISFFLALSSCFASDSLRTETLNGKQVMVYRVEQGQTLFSIARKYSISVNEIKTLNPNMAQLKTGSEIFLPSKTVETKVMPIQQPKGTDDQPNQLTHKVKQGETFYKISRQYNISVSELMAANPSSNSLKVGQDLIIPQNGSTIPKQNTTISNSPNNPTTSTPYVVPKSEKKTSATGYPSISETGIAKLDENFDKESTYSVQHKTAAIGTILLIKNKENGNTAHAKVTGTAKNSETSLLVVNKKVFEKLESKTNTFAVEIFYTPEQ